MKFNIRNIFGSSKERQASLSDGTRVQELDRQTRGVELGVNGEEIGAALLSPSERSEKVSELMRRLDDRSSWQRSVR